MATLLPPGKDPTSGDNSVVQQQVKLLSRWATLLMLFFVVVTIGCVVALLILLDEPRTADLRRLAILSILASAAGSSVVALQEVVEQVAQGWELPDGTKLRRGSHLAVLRDFARIRRLTEAIGAGEERSRAAREPTTREGVRQNDEELDPSDDFFTDDLFSLRLIPGLVARPLVGGALGIVLFSGVVGGFLVASGAAPQNYSVPGLVFLSSLVGFFSSIFVSRLRDAAEALFGNVDSNRPPEQSERR